MALNKDSATISKPNRPDVLPDTPQTPCRSDAGPLAVELPRVAGSIKRPRAPELREFNQMAGLIIAAGYYNKEERAGASTSGRAQSYKALSDARPGWARLLRKMLNAEPPPEEDGARKAALKAHKMSQGGRGASAASSGGR